MDQRVEKCTRALMEAILSSEEYINFEKAKEQIAGEPEKRKIADDFRRRAYLLQSSDSSIDLLDEMNRLAERRQELRKDEVVTNYLAAELAFCRMLQKISLEVMNAADIQIEALKDVISI